MSPRIGVQVLCVGQQSWLRSQPIELLDHPADVVCDAQDHLGGSHSRPRLVVRSVSARDCHSARSLWVCTPLSHGHLPCRLPSSPHDRPLYHVHVPCHHLAHVYELMQIHRRPSPHARPYCIPITACHLTHVCVRTVTDCTKVHVVAHGVWVLQQAKDARGRISSSGSSIQRCQGNKSRQGGEPRGWFPFEEGLSPGEITLEKGRSLTKICCMCLPTQSG
jgi:hypothetical protein